MASGKYEKKKKVPAGVCIGAAVAVLTAFVLVVGSLLFVLAGGQLISRQKAEIDLGSAGISSAAMSLLPLFLRLFMKMPRNTTSSKMAGASPRIIISVVSGLKSPFVKK